MLRKIIFTVMLVAACAYAQENKAQILSITGDVQIGNASAGWHKAAVNDMLDTSMSVKTGPGSSVQIGLNSHVLDIDADSTIAISKFEGSEDSGVLLRIKVFVGTLMAKVDKLGKGDSFEVETPTAVAGVRGTEFEVNHASDGSGLDVYDGTVEFRDSKNPERKIMVDKLSRASFRNGKFPERLERIPADRLKMRMARWEQIRALHKAHREKYLKLRQMIRQKNMKKFRNMRENQKERKEKKKQDQ